MVRPAYHSATSRAEILTTRARHSRTWSAISKKGWTTHLRTNMETGRQFTTCFVGLLPRGRQVARGDPTRGDRARVRRIRAPGMRI